MQTDLIISISQSLREVYEKYKDRGLRTVYLWGSLTTGDFDIKTSDVDGIGIIDDSTDIGIENEIKHDLESRHPEVIKFGFRVAYVGELKSEMAPKSPLASVILPRLLLLDMHNWTFVAGKQYVQSDFTDAPPTPEEGLYWRLEQLKNKGWKSAEDVGVGSEQRFSKIVWRIIYLFQMMRGIDEPFSYSSVVSHANDGESPFVAALQAIKKSGYEREQFITLIPVFNEVIERARQQSIISTKHGASV